MCGEQHFSAGILRCIRGSPPRVRGTVICPRFIDWRLGITPACAGNSATNGQIEYSDQDHPRVCGEQHWMTI